MLRPIGNRLDLGYRNLHLLSSSTDMNDRMLRESADDLCRGRLLRRVIRGVDIGM